MAAGYALKVAGKVAAFAVGTGFIGLQTLSYLGYVQVDWRKVERDATARFDKDGDGELTANDLRSVLANGPAPTSSTTTAAPQHCPASLLPPHVPAWQVRVQ